MTENLRDRIAKAIYLEANNWGFADWETISPKIKPAYLSQADAVIEALRLRPVEGTVSRFESKTYRRYITDWTPDD